MHDVADLRKGLKVEIDGAPYSITDFNFVKPGKGQAVYTCKLKNLINGSTLTRTYRSGDKVDEPHLENKKLQYSYPEGDNYVFMDQNYEQVVIGKDILGDNRFFLVEDLTVDVLYHNTRPIEVSMPTFVERA
ncbi:MAG: elongation factor P, partial [Bacteroidota bacterium]